MTIRQRIINLLIDEELTAEEIGVRLDVPKERIVSYVSTLKQAKKIEVMDNNRRPYIYRAITPKALLKRLYELMDNKMDFIKAANNKDINLIKQVETVIL